MCYREIECVIEDDGIYEGCQREEHDGESEQVACAGLDAEKSADAGNENENSDRRSEDSNEIERKQALEGLNYRGNTRKYVDEADDASYLFIFAFCHC